LRPFSKGVELDAIVTDIIRVSIEYPGIARRSPNYMVQNNKLSNLIAAEVTHHNFAVRKHILHHQR
jgi:hypothetical protein